MADRVVDLIAESAERLAVDGVDLVQEEGCGWKNFRCQDQVNKNYFLLNETH